MLLRKKGSLDVYSPIVAIVGIALLWAIISMVFLKQYSLTSEFDLGREQLRLFNAYSEAEKALLFVDNSARLSLEQAAYLSGKGGFRPGIPTGCVNRNGMDYWQAAEIKSDESCVPRQSPPGCYPDQASIESGFKSIFESSFATFIKGFNDKGVIIVDGRKVELPFEYALAIQPVAGRTEMTGISGKHLTISSVATNPLKYEVKPNFRESIPVDIVAQGVSLVETAKQLAGKGEDDARAIVASADNANGLDWDEGFIYGKKEASCPHVIGVCSCCKVEQQCVEYDRDEMGEIIYDKDGNPVCIKHEPVGVPAADGTLVETVPYDSVDVVTGVKAIGSSGAPVKFYVYDEGSKKVAPKGLEYKFALNWIDAHPEDAETVCSCGEGYPCGGSSSED